MSLKKKITAAALALAGTSLMVVGCSNSESASESSTTTTKTEAAEKSEKSEAKETEEASDGKLVIYSGRSEKLVDPLIEDFRKTVDYDVDVRYGKTPDQAQLILTEGESSPADVFFSQEAGALGLLSDQDMLVTLPDDVLKMVPAGFSGDDKTWVGITGRARVVAYDKEQVSEADAPDTIEEMVDPKWKGQTGVAPGNASFIAFVSAMRVDKGDDFTKEWLQKLAANEPKFYEKNTHVLEAVEKGEVQMGFINHYYWFRAAKERGGENLRAQLKYGADGDLAALVNSTGVGILKKAENDPKAMDFVKYLLSKEGQTYFTTKTFEFPLVDGIETPEGVPSMDSMKVPDVDLSKLGDVKGTVALIDEAGLSAS
ncbi:iron ABC transporter substrate-binding protein [Corynebacterium spheniscorum]|nr:iron ABC transporter substrate-binding protein [Corynebacterium spheniscorum]